LAEVDAVLREPSAVGHPLFTELNCFVDFLLVLKVKEDVRKILGQVGAVLKLGFCQLLGSLSLLISLSLPVDFD